VEALRCGIAAGEFWELTPWETFQAIEAAGWRAEQDARRDVALAWHVAALSRAKTLPPLRRLLRSSAPKPLSAEDIERKKREHAALMEKIDLSKLTSKMKRGRNGT